VPARRVAAVSTPADATTYTVHAHRWARGWELHIDGVGVTQSRKLNDAEKMARDYIALDTGTAPDSFNVEIIPQVDGKLDEEARAARRAVSNAEKAQRTAAAMSRDIAKKLLSSGLTGREIAVFLGISPQRVSQLLRDHAIRGRIASLLPVQHSAEVVVSRNLPVGDLALSPPEVGHVHVHFGLADELMDGEAQIGGDVPSQDPKRD
jgi:hypothetical protein